MCHTQKQRYMYLLCVCFRQMKTFEESGKSQKTVASMIENKKYEPRSNKKKGKAGKVLERREEFFVLSNGIRNNELLVIEE